MTGEFIGRGSSGKAIGGSRSFRSCCARVVVVVAAGVVASGGSAVSAEGV